MQNRRQPHSDADPECWQKDYEQVQEILMGTQEQWAQLYQDAYHIVLSTVRQTDHYKLLSHQEYEDITDEAFARSYAQLDQFRPISRFSIWVSGIARNITRDRRARQQTRIKYSGHLEELAKNEMACCDPFWVLGRYERNRCLWRAFFNLDRVDQEIVIRRLLEDGTFKRIAVDLQLPRKEVRSRLNFAKARMRSLFLHYYNHIRQ